jgi:hypothetical protein
VGRDRAIRSQWMVVRIGFAHALGLDGARAGWLGKDLPLRSAPYRLMWRSRIVIASAVESFLRFRLWQFIPYLGDRVLFEIVGHFFV